MTCYNLKTFIAGHNKTKELIPNERTKETKEKSKRNDDLNDVLKSDNFDNDSDVQNNTTSDDKRSKFKFEDEDFDTGNEYGHRRIEKIHSQEAIGSQRCAVGSVWEINCFNCFCGLNGRPSCDKIAHCSQLPYGNRINIIDDY